MTKKAFKCALCGTWVSYNVYYCPKHEWYLCLKCVNKSIFTGKFTCPKDGYEVHKVD